MNRQTSPDIARTTLIVLIIGVMLAASLWTMLPFVGSLVWATAIVVATWPLLLRVQRLFGGRRSLATAAMSAFMVVIFIAPFWVAIGSLLEASTKGIEIVRSYMTEGLPPPPAWVPDLPFVGARLALRWQTLADAGPEGLTTALRPYLPAVAAWMVTVTGGFGSLLVNVVLTVIIAAILYARGEVAAEGVLAFARRIASERGEKLVHLMGQAIRGVALGVVVTALLQAGLCGLGLWVSGTPHPGLLTAVAFVLCIAQIGPLLVFVAAVAWHFWAGNSGWATALIVWTLLVGPLDNILRPILIRRGVDLPMLLIIAGVIGGLLGFGVIGLFIGPVILAVTYAALEAWVVQGAAAPTTTTTAATATTTET